MDFKIARKNTIYRASASSPCCQTPSIYNPGSIDCMPDKPHIGNIITFFLADDITPEASNTLIILPYKCLTSLRFK